MQRLARAGAVLVLLAGVLTGCTTGPSMRPAIIGGEAPAPQQTGQQGKPQTRPVPPLDKSTNAELFWQACPDGVRRNLETAKVDLPGAQCSTITPKLGQGTVPSMMDVNVNLLRVGNGPVPLLVLNDVDGEPGSVYAARLATTLPKEILDKFTLIGMDRRGSGASDGLDCVPEADRGKILGYDPGTDKLDDLINTDRDAVQQCQVEMENTLPSFNTANTVSDIELLRTKLHVQHLAGIGRGEGSRLLSQYASQYPGHAGRMVFDGFPDPNAEIQDRFETRATAAEQTFDAFAEYCRENACPLGADPRGSFTAVLNNLRQKPLPGAGNSPIGPGLATNAVLTGLAERSRWDELAAAIAKARDGDGSGLAAFLDPLLHGGADNGARFDVGVVTGCNDEDARTPPQQAAATVQDWRAQSPLFGAGFGQRLLWCLPWPAPAKPVGKPNDTLPPNLVLSTANDPVTPDEGTQRVAQQIPATVRVSYQGAGHGALGVSECATNKAVRYLVDGSLPSSNTSCPA